MQAVIFRGILAGKLRCNRVEVGFGLGRRHTRLEPAYHEGIPSHSVIEPRVAYFDPRLHHHRHPNLRPVIELSAVEIARRYAQHRIGLPIDANRLPNDRWVSSESRLPRVITEHCVGALSGM